MHMCVYTHIYTHIYMYYNSDTYILVHVCVYTYIHMEMHIPSIVHYAYLYVDTLYYNIRYGITY